jgi:hypothetical protein
MCGSMRYRDAKTTATCSAIPPNCIAQPLQNLHVEITSNTLSRRYELKVIQTVNVKNSGNFLTAHRIPLVEEYIELFYLIDEGGIPFI